MPEPITYHTAQNVLNFNASFRTVSITAHKLYMRDIEHYILMTENEESALLLKSTFLTGQYKEVNEIRDRAHAEGFGRALILSLQGRLL